MISMPLSRKQGRVKVCLDTNVWISSILRGGNPARIIKMAEEDTLRVFLSSAILKEISRVLHYPKIQKILEGTGVTPLLIIEKITEISEFLEPDFVLDIVPDESDNRILECATAVGVDFIISGDRHLTTLKSIEEIPIVTPAEFLSLMNNP